jgi:UDP-glucose 4-epimerase
VVSLKEVADLLVEIAGDGEYIMRPFPPDRKRIDIGDYYADYSLVHSLLRWKPRTPLREGLERTVSFYRQQLSHYL